jgi:WD40 repeat protein/serine/threonine protein kinase
MQNYCPNCRSAVELPPTTDGSAISCPNCGSQLDSRTRADDVHDATVPLNAEQQTGNWHDESADSGPRHPRTIGDYELIRELARGGMGVVYKARQRSLDRIVALKMILAGELASESEVKRFYTEAIAAANLDHPGIVPIFEVGQHEGQHFFSMAFVEGESLSARLARGPLRPREAADLVRRVATAVQYAHEKGVVHRDLKPANILLEQIRTDSTGGATLGEATAAQAASRYVPKLTDFGLAKRIKGDSGLTAHGQILGTPNYMPPEQASGRTDEIGPVSDVYALGAVLYSCLTARPPFQSATLLETLSQVLRQEPISPRALNPTVDRDLATICMKCLEKEMHRRYQSAAELAGELERFLNGEPIHARPIGRPVRVWRWCKRNPVLAGLWALGAVFLLTLSIAGPIVAIQQAALKNDADRQRKAADDQRIRAEHNTARAQQRLYAAQMLLAQKAWQDGYFNSMRQTLQDQVPTEPGGIDYRGFEWHYWNRLADTALLTFTGHQSAISAVTFSPDGKYLASASWDKTVKVWNPSNGAVTRTLRGHTERVESVAFSSDGNYLASGSNDRTVRIWDAKTGRELRTLTGHTGPVESVGFSPDGGQIVSGGGVFRKLGEVKVWDRATGNLIASLTGHTGLVRSVAFSPDGRHVASSDDNRSIRIWDSRTGRQTGLLKTQANVRCVAFSPDGHRLAHADGSVIVVRDMATRRHLLTIEGHYGIVRSIAFSPDGRHLGSSAGDWTARVWDLTTGRQKFAFGARQAAVVSVAFSPDGRRLAASSQAAGSQSVKVWDITRNPEVESWQGHTSAVKDVVFSPKGLRLATGDQDGTIKVWDTISRTLERTFTRRGTAVTTVRFDGEERLVVTLENGKVWSIPIERETDSLSYDDCFSATVSLDGQRVAALSRDRWSAKVLQSTDGEQLFSMPVTSSYMSSLTPVRCLALDGHGRRLAMGGDSATAEVFEVDSGRRIYTLPGCPVGEYVLNYAVFALALDPAGRQLAVGCFKGVVLIWDLTTGKQVHTLEGHDTTIRGLAFSPDGKRLASASRDQTVRVWDLTSGQEVLSFRRNTEPTNCLAFSPGADCLAAGTEDGMIHVWTTMPTDCRRLHGTSRSMVRQSEAASSAYLMALRWAVAACRQEPENGFYLNTLGLAQYRLGEYRSAIATLNRSAKINAARLRGEFPADAMFLAMAHHRLGETEPVKANYQRLRSAMSEARWSKDKEALAFLAEVEQVLGVNR